VISGLPELGTRMVQAVQLPQDCSCLLCWLLQQHGSAACMLPAGLMVQAVCYPHCAAAELCRVGRLHTWGANWAVMVCHQQHCRLLLAALPAYLQDDVADVVVCCSSSSSSR
jgi:hypothetical protein